MRSIITISRKWNNPQIQTNISLEGIELMMSIEDFKIALLKEIGSITFTFTEKSFNKQLNDAINNILQGIKDESAKVVA